MAALGKAAALATAVIRVAPRAEQHRDVIALTRVRNVEAQWNQREEGRRRQLGAQRRVIFGDVHGELVAPRLERRAFEQRAIRTAVGGRVEGLDLPVLRAVEDR